MIAGHVAVMEAIGRLSLALILGVLIGLERQWHLKLAGVSTNALVALGSCGFVVFGSMVSDGDPTQIAAQVVSGIGFLGAGVILREGDQRARRQHCRDSVVRKDGRHVFRRRTVGAEPSGHRFYSSYQLVVTPARAIRTRSGGLVYEC